MQGAPQIGFENTSLGVRYRVIKDLPNGNRFVRHAECIVPNTILIPNTRETGTTLKRKERCTELSWAVPIDNEHVTGLSIVAWPLEDGEPKNIGGPVQIRSRKSGRVRSCREHTRMHDGGDKTVRIRPGT